LKLTDGGGLYLLLNPTGSRWWRFDYRYLGKRQTLSLGTYPDTGLADARAKRDEERKRLIAGINPSAHRKATKAAGAHRAGTTFELVAREWFAIRQPTWVKGHANKVLLWLKGTSNNVILRRMTTNRPVTEPFARANGVTLLLS